MAQTVVLDEIHITIRIPRDLPKTETDAARRILVDRGFLRTLRRAVRAAVQSFPALTVAHVTLSR